MGLVDYLFFIYLRHLNVCTTGQNFFNFMDMDSNFQAITVDEVNKLDEIFYALKRNGFVHLKSQTTGELDAVTNSLGVVIMTTDVVVKSESKGLVTTVHGIDFHTDHHKAKYVVWHCIKQTDKGGESLLVDAKNIYLAMPNDLQEKLKSVSLFEHKIFNGDKNCYPFVEIDENNNFQFHCSLTNDADKKNPSFIYFENLMNKTKPVKIRLEEKDILIIDNHRIFHGRTAIDGSKDRHLRRYWIQSNTINLNK